MVSPGRTSRRASYTRRWKAGSPAWSRRTPASASSWPARCAFIASIAALASPRGRPSLASGCLSSTRARVAPSLASGSPTHSRPLSPHAAAQLPIAVSNRQNVVTRVSKARLRWGDARAVSYDGGMKWLFVPLTMATLWACGSHSNSASVGPGSDAGALDADLDAEADGGVPCDSTGVSKGPWVLHVDGTSAVVRWETCRPGTPLGVSYAPETGGSKKHATATESAFVTLKTIRVFNASAPPDFAGTWYMHDAAISGLSPSTCYSYG